VTSPTPGDGKSTVVCNLGIALAEVKGRVLLIDADTRNPSLHRMFNIRNTVGLTDILRGDAEFSDSLLNRVNPVTPLALGSTVSSQGNPSPGSHGLYSNWTWDWGQGARDNGSAGRHGLYLLSLGAICENASALLYSDRMNLLLQKVRGDFDMILIDTPPMLQVPNARVLGRHTDGVVLVLRSGQTSTILAREAVMRLENDFISTFGAVLNAFDSRRYPYRYYGPYRNSEKSES
jgi:Mrp family chromosome partitioning ATPase